MSRGLWNTAAQFAKRGYAAKAPWYFNIPLLSSRGGTTASLPGEQSRDANAARIHKSVRVCSHMVHQKAPCCKAGRFSYVDLYWENRHLVSGLPFLVYTSEYSISGLRMCLQNGGSAVSWKSELNPPSWTVFCRLPRRENCDSQENTMNQRRKLCGVHNFRRWLWWL